MATAAAASKCLFLFLLSVLVVCSSEVSPVEEIKQKGLKRKEEQMFHSSHREPLNNIHYKAIHHDSINPPTIIFPTTPVTNTGTTPSNNPTPTIITVPSTNPTTPASTPLTVPNATPVYTPVPVTNPVTTPTTNPVAPPVMNPVTTSPAPPGNVPVTTPVVTPPAVPGQSWCVAKTGTLQTALQSALDYACGIGGADCSAIQQAGSCYNPNSLQNHASYAFSSYYQKNPVQSSCDFGGTAMITYTNPSSGSCTYPSSSTSSSTTSSSSPVTATPTTSSSSPVTATPTTTSSSGATVPGADTPTVLNTSYPASGMPVFGESPPSFNTSTSISTGLQPLFGCIILVTSMITGIIIQDM